VRIQEFLETWVEGYLIEDLKTLENVQLPEGKNYGAVGYPLVATVAAGIELLGALLLKGNGNAEQRFNYYWDKYLKKMDPAVYGVEAHRELVRTLCRDGIAHIYLAKPGIIISKDGVRPAIVIDSRRTSARVDVLSLSRDLRRSYVDLVRPVVFDQRDDTIATTMEKNLNAILQSTAMGSQAIFNKVPASDLVTSSFSMHSLMATGSPPGSPAPYPMTGAWPVVIPRSISDEDPPKTT
jgi:hypothetical protein